MHLADHMLEDTVHPPDVEPMADVGILLVHGIGDHAEADTLLSLGEPLIDWLRDWMCAPPGRRARGQVRVVEARLRALRTEADSPAFARVAIEQTRAGSPALAEEWLFAESWWGDSVRTPGTARLLAWMFSRLPLLVVWHFFGGSRGGPDDPAPAKPATPNHVGRSSYWDTPVPAWIALTARAIAVPLLIVMMQAVVALSLVLWIVPIGPWRQALLAAVRVMTLTLGDSFVLLEQDVQRAALVERVARSLRWLQSRASQVVVIAHSQGGAIAHEALNQALHRGKKVAGFISVGSGLEKLEFLRLVRDKRRGLLAGAVAGPALALGALGLLAGGLGWVQTSGGWWVVPAVMFTLGLVLGKHLVTVQKAYRAELQAVLAASAVASGAMAGRWWDVHATLDLVPMGSASLLPKGGVVEPVELRNECSLLSDHVAYFDTRCGFAAWCWLTLAGISRLELFADDERRELQQLGLWHARRAFGLSFGTSFLPLSIVCAALLFTEGMAGIGQSLFEMLGAASLDWTQRAVQWSMKVMARLVGVLPGFENAATDLTRRSQVLLAATVGAAAVALWWAAAVALWRSDSRARWRQACRGDSWLTGTYAAWIGVPMVLGWCLWAMLPLLALLVASNSPDALSLGSLGRATALVIALVLIVMAFVGGWGVPWLPRSDMEKELVGRPNHPMWPLFSSIAMAVYGVMAHWVWRFATSTTLDQRFIALALAGCGLSWTIAVTWQRGLSAKLSVLSWLLPPLLLIAAWAAGARATLAEWAAIYMVLALLLAGVLRSRLA